MTLPDDSPAVALILAEDVAVDALLPAADTLREFEIQAVVVTPDELIRVQSDGRKTVWCAVIVASGDAILPAAVAEAFPLPVVRVPMESAANRGLALLQSPGGNLFAPEKNGVSFATVAIGSAGAKNAALFVVSVLAVKDERIRQAWETFRAAQTASVLRQPLPTLG